MVTLLHTAVKYTWVEDSSAITPCNVECDELFIVSKVILCMIVKNKITNTLFISLSYVYTLTSEVS